MRVAEPVLRSWKASLALRFERREGKSVLAGKRHDGPLVVQKPLYPEGDAVCHAIVVHPPGGVAGGDELEIELRAAPGAHALLTTPGAAKWYRSSGPWARQVLSLHVDGCLEWLPQEAIVFDGALADLQCEIELAPEASYLGWEILCLGRTGSGERFTRGRIRTRTAITRSGKLLWFERASIEGGSALMHSQAGLGGRSVCGTFIACAPNLGNELVGALRRAAPDAAVTLLPGVLLARYLGDSSEAARRHFVALWRILRPALAGCQAQEPRIWST